MLRKDVILISILGITEPSKHDGSIAFGLGMNELVTHELFLII